MALIELSDDKARLQVDIVQAWLTTSYWSPGISREQVRRSIDGLHCLGAYDDTGAQLAFARAITDHSTLAWLADIWVDAAGRGQGLGRRMVQWFIDHPDFATVRRFVLVTRDAHGVYVENGFEALARSDRYMERLSPELKKLLYPAS